MADYRFIIVDDHPLFRGALSQALSASFENAEILEAGSLDELTERLATAIDTDLILLDLTCRACTAYRGSSIYAPSTRRCRW